MRSCLRGHRHATGTLSLRRRHSTCSQGADQTCVEVAFSGEVVAVRDPENPSGPLLRFTPAEWRVFVCGVKAGEFGLPPDPAHRPTSASRAASSSRVRPGPAATAAAAANDSR